MFDLGMVLCTPGAKEAISEEVLLKSLGRHNSGDWGELSDQDKAPNDEALPDLKKGGVSRILSKYSENGESFYIITNISDGSIDADFVTTVCLVGEY